MYRKWVAVLFRESVVDLDSSSICANGEFSDRRFILRRGRNAPLQEDDDRAISFWPRRMANTAIASAGHGFSCLDVTQCTYRSSTCLPMPTLTLTRVSSSIVLIIGILLEW